MATKGATVTPVDDIFSELPDLFSIDENQLFFNKRSKRSLKNELETAKAEIASLKLQLNASHLLCSAKQEILEDLIKAQIVMQGEVEALKENLAAQTKLQQDKAVQSEILISALTKKPAASTVAAPSAEEQAVGQRTLRKRKNR